MNYALWGEQSGTWISYKGRVLVHDNRAELEFLFPDNKVVPCDAPGIETLSVKHHPQFASVRWPLRREDFW